MNHQSYQQRDRCRVLLVDDEPLIRITLAAVARTAGYEVETAANGREGLKMFREGDWDIVVTDRNMPELDGEEMTAEIKKLAPATPVIMITARWSDVATADQFVEILGKPFSLTRFVTTLKSACPEKSAAGAR